MPFNRRTGAAILGAVFATFGGACGSGTLAPTVDQFMGAYTLTAVNGQPMPSRQLLTVFQNGSVVSDSSFVLSGSMIINAGSSFHVTLTFRDKLFSGTQVISDQTETDPTVGVWTLNGSTLSFAFTEDGVAKTYPGTITLPTITVTETDTIPISAAQTTVRTTVFTFTKQ